MKLRKCENGHFYDEEKYAFCPHCQRENGRTEDDFTISLTTGDNIGSDEAKTEPLTMPQEKPSISITPPVEKSEPIFRENENLTVSFYSQKIGIDPVVGWLICIEGAEKGRSFELHAGRNFVGRGKDMDVVLSDSSVSRNKHAIIIYEAKNKMFIAQAGESRELFYVNDEVVLSNTKLEAYDTLLIGDTKLAFIPFCGDKFSWEVKEDNENK